MFNPRPPLDAGDFYDPAKKYILYLSTVLVLAVSGLFVIQVSAEGPYVTGDWHSSNGFLYCNAKVPYGYVDISFVADVTYSNFRWNSVQYTHVYAASGTFYGYSYKIGSVDHMNCYVTEYQELVVMECTITVGTYVNQGQIQTKQEQLEYRFTWTITQRQ